MKKTDVEREIKTMTENRLTKDLARIAENRMSKYRTTILQVSIHREESNPIFGEGNTYVSVDDEAGGPFITIQQSDDCVEAGKVKFDYGEFVAVAEAAKMLMHQMYIEQAAQEYDNE